MISYDDFKKLDLRVAKILAAERVEGSEKLVKLQLSLGTEERQIVAGIGKAYDPAALLNRDIVIVANLEPRLLMGIESQGMLLAVDDGAHGPALLLPDQNKEIPPGACIK